MKMKLKIFYTPTVRQQELKDNWNIKLSSSSSPALEATTGSPVHTGSETDCTPTTTETDTTGTGVHFEKVTATVIGTDETTEITIAHTEIVFLLLNVNTETGSWNLTGSEPARTTGIMTATDTPTITTTDLKGAMSGGDTPTVRSPTADGGGTRTVETHDQRRTEGTPGRETITDPKRGALPPLHIQKQTSSYLLERTPQISTLLLGSRIRVPIT